MTEPGLTKRSEVPTFGGMRRTIVMAAVMAAGLGGCVNVSAPDKPIEINLNIKITQEVIYRLDREAKALIKDNPDIF
jgi:hypothetical protein